MPSLGVKIDRDGKLATEPDLPDERFPSVFLSKEQIDALGLGPDDLGKDMVLKASIKVDSFSVNERAEGDSSKDASISLLSGDLERASSEDDKAELLFGSSD